jgi:L-ascorbate metabolism protein UlaG (beta-lactamase superfamily)
MTALTMTLIGGPTVLIEADGFRVVTDPTFDAPGELKRAFAALDLHSRLQMLEPGVATAINAAK